MSEYYPLEQIDQIAEFVRSRYSYHPQVGIILGSGLGALAASVESATIIPYNIIQDWPVSTVVGHQGHLVVGKFAGKEVIVMQGRVHYYEGYSMAQVTLPIRVLQRIGIDTLIVTNAAGAVNPSYSPGDLMLISDHINLIGMSGLNPLRGPNLDALGTRFPDMSQAYDQALMELARKVANEEKMTLHEGVYICLAGPSFETPADLRFLRIIGADAVGMSTVPEVIAARHGGTRVLGISGISNKANLDGETVTNHEEVLEAGQKIAPKLTTLIRGVLRRL
ncbi:MAG TPA: purine-nucleoside phosphorylase [Anaerolineales bacterium]|nr:purine-nucleoside phosphorylase [Anaerolineales bacterium]